MVTRKRSTATNIDSLTGRLVVAVRAFTAFARSTGTRTADGDLRFFGHGLALQRLWAAMVDAAGEVHRWIVEHGLPPSAEVRARGSDELPNDLAELSDLVSAVYMPGALERAESLAAWRTMPAMDTLIAAHFPTLLKSGNTGANIVIANHRLDEMEQAATEIERRFSNRKSAAVRLTPKAKAVLMVLQELGPDEAIQGREIINRLGRLTPPLDLDQSSLTKNIIPELKRMHGVQNRPGAGYYIAPPH